MRTELTFEDVVLMYDMCRYEAAWQPHLVSVWCAVFDDSDLEVGEMKTYSKNLQIGS